MWFVLRAEAMTLTDSEEKACCSMQPIPEHPETSDIGLALREVVWQAQEQGRLRCGVLECAQLLEIEPFSVMLCVMPVTGPHDVSAVIERTLMEAFCHEYQIRLLKVDSINKLGKVLQGRNPSTSSSLPEAENPTATPTPTPPRVPVSLDSDMCSCVLVQYPESGEASSLEEEAVAQHFKEFSLDGSDDNFNAVVALPDD